MSAEETDNCSDAAFRSECRTEWRAIKSTLSVVMGLLQASIDGNAVIASRLAALEGGSRGRRRSGQREWICPVCEEPFAHRESFKGHVRKLTLPHTGRRNCELDPLNARHQALVAHPRYGTGDFNSRGSEFVNQLYHTIRSASSSTRSSDASHDAVRSCSTVSCMSSYIFLVMLPQIHQWLDAGALDPYVPDVHGQAPRDW
jgi:hypothetical protein